MTAQTSGRTGVHPRRGPVGRHRSAGSATGYHRRTGAALAANGLSSLGNFLMSLAIARGESLSGLGQFALSFSVYIFAIGLVRATVTEGVLAGGPQQTVTAIGAGVRRACAMGAGIGAVAAGAGLMIGSRYLVIVGIALCGLVVYDYTRGVSLGMSSPRAACAQDAVWTGATALGVLAALLGLATPLVIFVVWAGSGAVLGPFVAARRGYRPVPGWGLDRAGTRNAISFGLQFLITSGSAQLALTGLAATAGVGVVGALGAAQTVFGPVALLTATLSAIVIPYLGRTRAVTARARLRTAGPVVLVAVGLIVPMALAISLLPDEVGRAVIGDNWAVAGPLLPLLGVEAVLVPAALVAFAGHRVHRAGARALLVGAGLGPVRVVVVVSGGLLFGARGAAAALAVMAVVSASCWWLSYLSLREKEEPWHGPA
ncbi:hypothetical protein ACFY3U_11000 [Micromonospora sp. NPDC000089]|uniref:hypothetical protein n=1 Tax=unclassified Micromonospora TaxID=2617518 RepID=UPI0036C00A3F